MTPYFGLGAFGETLFYTRYSRVKEDGTNEDWCDVIIRCVEGVFSIRKDWYLKNQIAWDQSYWDEYAFGFATAMYEMKFLPPGRGLWAMGTEFIFERGSMALQNCGFKLIGKDIANDAHWCMDALMCGVGVGFKPERDDTLQAHLPTETMTFLIPDTREGWCDSLAALIRSYLVADCPKPEFDYSEIRPEGLPIKGFGGISSGPEPLKKLHEQVEYFFERFIANKDGYDSVLLKADIINAIGCCVVAGNVRRSAEIACGDIDDDVFMNLKDYTVYPYRAAFGWMSNNSAILSEKRHYGLLGKIAKRVIANGEPGIINYRNMWKGRIGKNDNLPRDAAIGFNPCLTYESKILTADGRGYVSIGQLADEGKDLDVFCVNDRDEITVKRMRNPRKTGEGQKIYKVTFDDGATLRCTGNHKVMLRDRSFKQVQDLSYNDQVAIVNRYDSKISKEGTYWRDYIKFGFGGVTSFEHKLIAENKFHIVGGDHVHHIDRNKKNNNPENLELKEPTSHLTDHSLGKSNPNFSGISNEEVLDIGMALATKLGRRFSQNEWDQHGVSLNSEFRKNYFGTFIEFSYLCADLVGVINEPLDPRTLRLYLSAIEQGYETQLVDNKVFISKKCESCGSSFLINYQQREQSFCSLTCGNLGRDYSLNVEGQRRYFAQQKESNREKQLDAYTELKTLLSREPLKKEWEEHCSTKGASKRLGAEGSAFRTWANLKNAANDHNHRVISVVEDGKEDVYNGTVDDFHNFIVKICDSESEIYNIERGVITPQCGEQPLEDGELCCLVETCPTRCTDNNGDFDPYIWFKATEYATFYASTVTLLPTHRHETNKVMVRNRRIGVSIMDYANWVHECEQNQVINYLREGYLVVRRFNKHYNLEAGVPESNRVTTMKPGGTVPKIVGVLSGMMNPNFHYMVRRVRMAINSPMVPLLKAAGVPWEVDAYSANTLCFEFPVHQGPAKEASKVSLWEQAFTLMTLQREWSDNAVSNTLTFKPAWVTVAKIDRFNRAAIEAASTKYGIDITTGLNQHGEEYQFGNIRVVEKYTSILVQKYNPNHEEDDIEKVLSCIVPHIKSLSLLPHSDAGVYVQMPEEGITKEEYERRLAAIKPIDWQGVSNVKSEPELYCTGPTCELPKPEEIPF